MSVLDKPRLLASTPTKEAMCEMLDRFFWSDRGTWTISVDMRPQNRKTNDVVDRLVIRKAGRRWRLETV